MAKKPAPTRVKPVTKKSKALTKATKSKASRARSLAPATYKRFWPKKLRTPRVKPAYKPLSKARILFYEAVKLLLTGKKTILGILAIYALGLLLLVVGFSIGNDFGAVREQLGGVFQSTTNFNSLLLQVVFLFSNANTSSTPAAGLYQSILLILCSLALIWAFRELRLGRPAGTKASFYQGMTPLIPFLGVVIIISLQLLPMTISAYLYNLVTVNGITVHWYEKAISLLLFLSMCFWSFRMISSSIFAPYAVTLPGMTPLQALYSVKELVRGRRLLIWRKLIFLPFALVLLLALAIAPVVLVLPVLAPWVFFLLTCLAFAMTHAYLYTLYRELIRG